MDRELLARIANRVDLRLRLEAIYRLTNMAEAAGKGNVFLDKIRKEAKKEDDKAGTGTPRTMTNRDGSLPPRPAATTKAGGNRRTGGLTPQEVKVVNELVKGDNNNQIGATMHLSGLTIKSHLEHIRKKWGSTDRASTVAQGYIRGLLIVPKRRKDK